MSKMTRLGGKFCYFVNFQISCGYCPVVSTVGVPMFPGDRTPEPSLPDGWNVLNGVPICAQHDVTVTKKT